MRWLAHRAFAALILLVLLSGVGLGCRRRPLWLDPDAGERVPVACPDLQPLAARGPLTPRRTRKVTFAPDGRAIALHVLTVDSVGASDNPSVLLIARLPEGQVGVVSGTIHDAIWLGATGDLLVVDDRTNGLSIVTVDGARKHFVAGESCGWLATADGARVYFVHGCGEDRRSGQLDAFEVASGAISHLAPAVLPGSIAVSPNGRWLAYLAAKPGPDQPEGGVLHVVDVGGDGVDMAVGSAANANAPAFIENGQVLFQSPAVVCGTTDVYRYFVMGGAPLRVAQDVQIGFGGYVVSPGLAFLLGARGPSVPSMPNQLVSFAVEGGREITLAADLAAYNCRTGPSAFGFSVEGARAVYVRHLDGGISSVPTNGAAPSLLSAGSAFALSPYADRLAAFDQNATQDAGSHRRTLHVRASSPGPDAFVHTTASLLSAPAFVAGDRGMVFVESPSGAPAELRYMAFSDGAVSVLARWNLSELPPSGPPVGKLTAGYPIDPKGCFAVVDSDLPGVTGTSLVLLPK